MISTCGIGRGILVASTVADNRRVTIRFRGPALIPLLIAVAGAGIVIYQWSGARPLWLDEEMIALNFRDRSFSALGGRLWLDQSAPLGWLALQRLVLLVFGSSELVLRAVPALFGVATVAAALFVGQRWLTTTGSAVFVLLCSIGEWMSFHSVELKPYSADTFWGVALPALAVAAAAAESSDARRRGVVTWAVAAAIGHWFALGGLLVLPACFIVLAVSESRGGAVMRRLAVAFAVVTASFAVHYLVAIRYTQSSTSLQNFWQFAMAPPGAGFAGTLEWLYGQLLPIALKPGGTALAASFWISVALGVLLAPARLLGAAAGLVVLSAFALGAARIMPLYERLSLWFVPALYLAIALFADRGAWVLRRKVFQRSAMNLATACVIFLMVGTVCVDIVDRGVSDLRGGRPRDTNHSTDDRTAVTWLMEQRRTGDTIITTRHAQPAIWWYGGVPISDGVGRQFPDGGRIFIVDRYTGERGCRGRELRRAIDRGHRIQVYLGFADTTPGFDDLLLGELSKYGTITAVRQFAGNSRAAVIDPNVTAGSGLFWSDAWKDGKAPLTGCVGVDEGSVW